MRSRGSRAIPSVVSNKVTTVTNWRFPLLALALVTSFLLVGYVRSGFDGEPLPPRFNMSHFPYQMGNWKGEELEILDETVQVLRCHSHLNRVYRDSLAHTVTLHMAAWLNTDLVVPAPHHPEVCYPAAGWEIMERRQHIFPTPDGEITCELMLHQKESSSVVTAHWYTLGDISLTGTGGFSPQRLKFWGTQSWPSTVKYLLQTQAPSIEAAEPVLGLFAEQVMSTVRELEERSSPSTNNTRSLTSGSL